MPFGQLAEAERKERESSPPPVEEEASPAPEEQPVPEEEPVPIDETREGLLFEEDIPPANETVEIVDEPIVEKPFDPVAYQAEIDKIRDEVLDAGGEEQYLQDQLKKNDAIGQMYERWTGVDPDAPSEADPDQEIVIPTKKGAVPVRDPLMADNGITRAELEALNPVERFNRRLVLGVGAGAQRGALEIAELLGFESKEGTFFGQKLLEVPEGFGAGLFKFAGQAGVAVLPVGRMLKILGLVNKGVKSMLAWGVADFAAFDPAEDTFAEWAETVPGLRHVVPDFLSSAPDDTDMEKRLKNALEGLLIGGAVGGTAYLGGLALNSIMHIAKAVRGKRALEAAAGGDPARAAEILGKTDTASARVAGEAAKGLDDAAAAVDDVAADTARAARDVGLPAPIRPGGRPDAPIAQMADEAAAVADEVVGAVDDAVGAGGTVVRAADEVAGEVAKVADDVAKVVDDVAPGAGGAARVIDDIARAADEAPPTPTRADPATARAGDEFVDPEAAPLFEIVRPKASAESALNINLERLHTSDDIKQMFKDVAASDWEVINKARREIQPHELTKELARLSGTTIEKVLNRKAGEIFNAEEQIAAMQILIKAAKEVDELAVLAEKPGSSMAVLNEYTRKTNLFHALQAQISGNKTETARALNAGNIEVGYESVRNLRAMENVLESGGPQAVRDHAAATRKLGAEVTAPTIGQKNVSQMLYELWVSGVLSGGSTQTANVFGNISNIALGDVTRFVAGRFRAGKKVGPQEANRYLSAEALEEAAGVQAQEWRYAVHGQFKSIPDAFRLGGRALKDDFGRDLIKNYQSSALPSGLRNVSKLEDAHTPAITGKNVGRVLGLKEDGVGERIADYIGSFIRIPGKLLNASDVLFKTISYRGELAARSYRRAVNEGLSGEALAKRVDELTNNPPRDLHAEALAIGEYQTFTKPLGELGQTGTKYANMSGLGRVIVPFIRTPTNILKNIVEHTPLAVLSKGIRADFRAGGARADMAKAKVAVGSGVLAIAGAAQMMGILTGDGPGDPKLKARLRETGWQPNSIKIGDTYISYSRLDPLAALLTIGATTAEILAHTDDEDTWYETALAAILAVSKTTLSRSWLQGVSDFVEVLDSVNSDPKKAMSILTRYSGKLAGSIVPTFVGDIEKEVDPTLRDTGNDGLTWLRSIQARTPGLSKYLPPVQNMYGEPVVLEGGIGPDFMSPFYASTDKNDPVSDELARLNPAINMPAKTILGVKLSGHEYAEYVRLAGGHDNPATKKTLKEALAHIMTTDKYKQATDGKDGGKSFMIQTVVQNFRKMGRAAFIKKNPDFEAKIKEQARKKQIKRLGEESDGG